MKLVVDTDVWLSALFSKRGASYRVVRRLAEIYRREHIRYNVVSNTLIIEFSAVLTRETNLERARLSAKEMESFIDSICLISHHQKINFMWRPFLKDKDDDMVLEVAFNAGADHIITHNVKDFKGVEEHFNITVLTPQAFIEKKGVIL